MNNDLISREALKKAYFNAINETSIGEVSIIDLIDNAPIVAVDEEIERQREELYQASKKLFDTARMLGVAKPKGEWITVRYAFGELNAPEKSKLDFLKCPFCETIHQGRHNFCSYCGADMRGDKNG